MKTGITVDKATINITDARGGGGWALVERHPPLGRATMSRAAMVGPQRRRGWPVALRAASVITVRSSSTMIPSPIIMTGMCKVEFCVEAVVNALMTSSACADGAAAARIATTGYLRRRWCLLSPCASFIPTVFASMIA